LVTKDKVLYQKIKNGNEQAYDSLFRKYYAPLCRFAYLFTQDDDSAEEVVQEFFIKLWTNRRKIKIKDSVKSYLYKSVRNASLNFIQKEKTRDMYEERYEKDRSEDRVLSPDQRFSEIYGQAVNKLPERTREVFILCKNEGLSYGEISDYLKISVKTVENNMGIAFRKLRSMLMPYKDMIYES
jgi:RNA polymerase sigma-70 factor (ECF subfamily)